MTQSNAYLYAMPAGIPGVANRLGGRMPEIEAQIMDPTNPLPFYGLFGVLDAATQFLRKCAVGDTAATLYGLLVRPYPAQPAQAPSGSISGATPLGTPAVPPQFQTTVDVMKSGRMTVLLQANNAGVVTQPVKGGIVYVCIQNPPAGGSVGGILGAADGGNTVALPQGTCYFMSQSDANNNIEVAYNI